MRKYGYEIAEDIDDEKIIKESFLFIKKASDAGDIKAISNYSKCFEEGIGVQVDLQKANFLLKISANNGCKNAILEYGSKLYDGDDINDEDEDGDNLQRIKEDIQNNKEEAFKYFKLSIDKGKEYIMVKYALILINGEGCQMNKEEGIKYIKAAIDKGQRNAINVYASMLLKGILKLELIVIIQNQCACMQIYLDMELVVK